MNNQNEMIEELAQAIVVFPEDTAKDVGKRVGDILVKHGFSKELGL